MFDKHSYLEQDLHELKLRYELLEGDRKAYYEQSQSTIVSNKTEITRLRTQNKELRIALGKLKKTKGSDRSLEHPRKTELEKYDHRVNELHKKADEMVSIVRSKEKILSDLRDKLKDLETEADLVSEVTEGSQQAAAMRRLENQLDKAEIKWHEAQAIRKVYEEILERMHEERQTFDAKLAGIEHALSTKRTDVAELQLMSSDAHHARDLSRTELVRIETQIIDDRKRREKDLSARRELVRQKLEASEKLEQALLASTLDTTLRTGDTEINSSSVEADVATDRLAEYDELIKHVKEATGVDDLRHVVGKFDEQQATYARLMDLAKTYESKLASAKSARATALSNLEEALAMGEHTGIVVKAAARELEAQLHNERAALNELVERDSRLKKMLGVVKAGVAHLWDKVKDDKTSKCEVTEDVGQVLEMCSKKIVSLLEAIHGKDVAIEGDLNSIPVHFTNQNTRVRLFPNAFESEDNDSDSGGGGDGLSGEVGDEEGQATVVPDRESIKKATLALLNARNKGKGSRKKKKRGAAEDGENEMKCPIVCLENTNQNLI